MIRIQILLIQMLMITGLNALSAQNIDRDRAAALELNLDKFNFELADAISAMQQASDLSRLKSIAKNIELSSGSLLEEVKAIYPVDENYWLDAALDNAVANDIQSFAPNTAGVLRTRAAITTFQGVENEKSARPSYFERIRSIHKHCKMICRSITLKAGRSHVKKIREKNIKA